MTLLVAAGCVSKSEYLIVPSASLEAFARHKSLLSDLSEGRKVEDLAEFVLAGHRITTGQGTVLAWRTYRSGIPLLVDQGAFSKLTVFVPEKLSDSSFSFDLDDVPGTVAFYASGSSEFPGHSGCVGYARRGYVRVGDLKDGKRDVTVRVDIDARSPLNWKGECSAFVFEERHRFQEKSVEALTPWEGAPGDHPYQESHPN